MAFGPGSGSGSALAPALRPPVRQLPLLLLLLLLLVVARAVTCAHEGDPASTHETPPSLATSILDFPYENRECHALLGKEPLLNNNAYIRYDLGPVSNASASASPNTLLQVAYIIYDYRDQNAISLGEKGTKSYKLICSGADGEPGCRDGRGGFVVSDTADRKMKYKYLTETVTLSNSNAVSRELSDLPTGFYCFAWVPSKPLQNIPIPAHRVAHSSTGFLPAEVYPRLTLLLVSLVIYAFLLFLWSIKLFMYWRDILPVQKYITGLFVLVVVSTALDLHYATHWNSLDEQSWLLLSLSAVASSARIAMSFFLLLIICMGYSVVRPSLGEQMTKCQLMALALFSTLSVYSVMVLKKAEWSGFLILAIILPLWLLMTAFYTMILSSLAETRQYLIARRQHFKTQMYRNLWFVIMYAVVNFIVFFFVSTAWYAAYRAMSLRASLWKYQWFLTDGWMHIIYGTCFLTICYLWRPTRNNVHYGLEEIMTDPLEDEFEMDKEMMSTFAPPSTSAANTDSQPLVNRLHSTAVASSATAPAPRQAAAPMFTLGADDDYDDDGDGEGNNANANFGMDGGNYGGDRADDGSLGETIRSGAAAASAAVLDENNFASQIANSGSGSLLDARRSRSPSRKI